MSPLRKSDVFRSEVITAPELLSDGYGVNSIYLSTVVSTTSSGVVTVSLPSDDVSLLYSPDYQVDSGDIVWIFGTSPSGVSDGYYTINQVLSDTSFSVNQPITDSTGGSIQFRFPSGASLVGFDSSGSCVITHNTVQGALKDLDAALCGAGGLTPFQHAELRQLIHLADGVGGPFEGFATGAYRKVSPPGALFPTSIVWFTDSTQTKKIIQKTVTYTGFNQPSTIQWVVYNTDGMSILATVTDTVYYSGIFEINRVRNIVDSTEVGTLDAQAHKIIRQLIHLADGVGGPFEGFASGAYREVTYPPGNPFESKVVWYTDNTKTSKIVEHSVIRNFINMPTSIIWKVYDVDGVTVLSTVTDNITYVNNIFETFRTRTII